MERSQVRDATRPGIWLAALAGLAAARSASPNAVAPRPPAPEIPAGDYRLVLEKFSQSENVVLEFDAQGHPAVSGRLNLNLQVAVHSRLPQQRLNLDNLDPRVVGFSQTGRPVTFQTYRLEDADAARTGTWRTLLMAQDADLDLTKLERLQGNLVVYPRAAVTTLDFPMTAKPPLKLQQGDLTATLRELRRDGDRVTVGLEVEWPQGARISRPNPELPYGISLLAQSGAVHAPSGGSSSTLPNKDGTGMRYTATFSEVREAATTARLELVVRSGTPEKIPFQFPSLPLPDTLGLMEDAGETAPALPPPGHSLYDENGGTLTVRLPGQAGNEGPVLIGLAPAAPGPPRSWRWIEADPAPDGKVTLTRLRPGSYQVRWTRVHRETTGARAALASLPIETRVVAGQPGTVTWPVSPPAGKGAR